MCEGERHHWVMAETAVPSEDPEILLRRGTCKRCGTEKIHREKFLMVGAWRD